MSMVFQQREYKMNKEIKVIMQAIQDYDEIIKKAWELTQDELGKGFIKKEQVKERIDWHTLGIMTLRESGVATGELNE
jgi:hypothetical protein